MELQKFNEQQKKFELAIKEAENFSLVQNAGSAFKAVIVVNNLREALTDEIMKQVFMPLMNTKIGFRTDRPVIDKKTGREIKPAYTVSEVRDAIIDAASFGLLPTFNQMNIIAGSMYPTKEGYTALLKKMVVKYFINVSPDVSKPGSKFGELQTKIDYEFKGQKNSFLFMAVVPKDAWSSYDQLKGKAERRGKKKLYEFLTGLDLGDSDTIDTTYQEVSGSEIVDQKEPEKKKVKL